MDAEVGSRVEVVKGRVEEISLPEPVDVLVSEPMGTLLVNERMLETYLFARDRFLIKSGGKMFPVRTWHVDICCSAFLLNMTWSSLRAARHLKHHHAWANEGILSPLDRLHRVSLASAQMTMLLLKPI